jgi:hypothetical protein
MAADRDRSQPAGLLARVKQRIGRLLGFGDRRSGKVSADSIEPSAEINLRELPTAQVVHDVRNQLIDLRLRLSPVTIPRSGFSITVTRLRGAGQLFFLNAS